MPRITYPQIREKMTEPYTMSVVGREALIVQAAVNQGIDAHLEACFCPAHGDRYDVERDAFGARLNCVVSKESLPTLIRRLADDMGEAEDDDNGRENETGHDLASAILTSLGFTEQQLGYGCFEIVSDVDL